MWELLECSGMWLLGWMPGKSAAKLAPLYWLPNSEIVSYFWVRSRVYLIYRAILMYTAPRYLGPTGINPYFHGYEYLGESSRPVNYVPDKKKLDWAHHWLPELFKYFRTRCTSATLEGGTGELLSRAYHIPGSLPELSCSSPRRCLLLATLYKLGTGGKEVSGIWQVSKCWNEDSNMGLTLKLPSFHYHIALLRASNLWRRTHCWVQLP